MDLDEEILQRLANTEDHFTERKTSPQPYQCTEAIVAFANSAIPNKPGILFIGVNDGGEVVGGENVASWQSKVTEWANGCFPEVPIIPRVLTKNEKEFLAVVVPLSEERPHFARPAFKRQGAKTVKASQGEIDEWISHRNSKVRYILAWKGKTVTFHPIKEHMGGAMFGPDAGAYEVLDCNPFFVTLKSQASDRIVTEPLSKIDLKMDDAMNRLKLLFEVYY